MNIVSIFNEFVVTGILLVLLLIISFTLRKRLRGKNSSSSKKATGIILAMEKITLVKEHHVEVKILVMVMPERNRNFVGELIETVLLTDLLLMKIGDKVRVEYSDSPKLMLRREC